MCSNGDEGGASGYGQRLVSMRALRVLFVFVAAVALSSCTGAARSDAPRQRLPPPSHPDLSSIVERYYQQIEGAHWNIAYAMLSERYRAAHDRSAFETSYQGTSNADISARQLGDRRELVRLTIPASGNAPARTIRETLTFAWDGEEWTVDDITR
jgi:hypothetical protein